MTARQSVDGNGSSSGRLVLLNMIHSCAWQCVLVRQLSSGSIRCLFQMRFSLMLFSCRRQSLPEPIIGETSSVLWSLVGKAARNAYIVGRAIDENDLVFHNLKQGCRVVRELPMDMLHSESRPMVA